MKRTQYRTHGLTLLAILFSILVLAACGGNGANSNGGEENANSPSADPTESRLHEQQEADVVLNPDELSASNTVFDPNITDGETLFVSYCAKCHGLGGLGDGPSVGSLRDPSGMNLTILQDRTDEEIFNTITGGKNVEMPPWGLVLTEEQRHALVDYVRSLGG